jgi:hypothetical protein
MNINKLSTLLTNTQSTQQGQQASNAQQSQQVSQGASSARPVSDTVSIDSSARRKDEQQFATTEFNKLNKSSFDNLRSMKHKLVEFEDAKKISAEAASQTEVGKLLNDPKVWEKIANRMLDF